jgi:thiol:disulfide interchange protein
VQGRYFLPMLPLAGATIASVATARRRFTIAMYPLVIAALALTTLGLLAFVAGEYHVLM